MKINFMKLAGGTLVPASDDEAVKAEKFKTGEIHEAEIKLYRNPQFHSKMFVFFEFCFQHWKGDREFMDDNGQKEVFRKNLVVLAGFYKEYYNIKGEVRIEAESLSYANMTQERFEQVYNAVIQAAMKHVFKDCSELTERRLMSFF